MQGQQCAHFSSSGSQLFNRVPFFIFPSLEPGAEYTLSKMEMKTSCPIFQVLLHRYDIYLFLFSLGLCTTESQQYRYKDTDNDTHKDKDKNTITKKTMTMLTNAPVAVLAPIKVDSLLLVDKIVMHIK